MIYDLASTTYFIDSETFLGAYGIRPSLHRHTYTGHAQTVKGNAPRLSLEETNSC